MWFQNCFFYQIYPFGFCGCPDKGGREPKNRIQRVEGWIPHLQALGVDAVYFCPIFHSDAHGYDTCDYYTVDPRLGTNADFAGVCGKLHKAGIRVVLDGVFNHVGRGFWAFRDVLEKREASPYKDWFFIDFSRDSSYNDGLWYEGWEGYYNLVKLNLKNPAVVEHLFGAIRLWKEQFGIDGLRLDVAYMLDEDFLRQLHGFAKGLNPDFYLLGEIIHGEYTCIVNTEMLDSCTNYECFKGIHSSLNDLNLFEIAYSLNRQFGPEQWTLYKHLPLLNFVDNHDVDRLASTLKEPCHLKAAYTLLFCMPGVPSVYYGSEWGAEGKKENGSDIALRPCFDSPKENELTVWIGSLARLRMEHPALGTGSYRQHYLTNKQLAFLREGEGERVLVALNIEDAPHAIPLPGTVVDLVSGERHTEGELVLDAFEGKILRLV